MANRTRYRPSQNRGRQLPRLFAAWGVLLAGSVAEAADPLIEIRVDGEKWVGQAAAHDRRDFWFLEQSGVLHEFPIPSVTDFRAIGPRFVGLSATDLRARLRNELGPEWEIKGSTHYLVAAPAGQAGRYVDLFEQMYRELYLYFSTRGFEPRPPAFPLVAIVFPSQQEFADYARKDGVLPSATLAGYYHLQTNRVAFFDEQLSNPATADAPPRSIRGRTSGEALSDALRDTLIHEATHQVAYNLGLHSRIGPSPRWVVEGLAMVFEHPDSRSAQKVGGPDRRLNRERYVWFQGYRQQRRPQPFLKPFLESDRLFVTATLDAYAEAWALSFFLMETRNSAYANYLKRIRARDPLQPYPAAERVRDFQASFGDDLERLEIEYLRFIDRL